MKINTLILACTILLSSASVLADDFCKNELITLKEQIHMCEVIVEYAESSVLNAKADLLSLESIQNKTGYEKRDVEDLKQRIKSEQESGPKRIQEHCSKVRVTASQLIKTCHASLVCGESQDKKQSELKITLEESISINKFSSGEDCLDEISKIENI
jgi:hypothetical protein